MRPSHLVTGIVLCAVVAAAAPSARADDTDAWRVSAAAGAWGFASSHDVDGFGGELGILRRLGPFAVGGRLVGLSELQLHLFGQDPSPPRTVLDVGPTAGVFVGGPVQVHLALTPALVHGHAPDPFTTAGLGVDVGGDVRLYHGRARDLRLGLGWFGDLNPERSFDGWMVSIAVDEHARDD
jgi:hypothetical protein